MKLILCEKQLQAEAMAKGLASLQRNKPKQNRAHIVVGDYKLYWAQGHLVKLNTKKIVDTIKKFPYFPNDSQWYITPSDKNAQFLLNNMKNDLKKADEIIIATDFGREGELIARLILKYLGYNKKAKLKRFWTSASLTPSVVKNSMQNIKDLDEFDLLYEEAKARQEADWLVGINLSTKLMNTIRDGSSWSLGRVQTPTLAIVVKRELEIQNFKPTPYILIEGKFKAGNAEYTGKLLKSSIESAEVESEDETLQEQEYTNYELKKFGFTEKEKSLIYNELDNGIIDSKIVKVKKQSKEERPLKLFTLTSLQTHMSRKYKMSIQETANICQWLYDNGVISYPRTESSYLSTENVDLVKNVLTLLEREDLLEKVNPKNTRVFNDKKVTDHHALIPTNNFVSDDKRKMLVYNTIKNSLLAQFYPNYKEDKLILETEVTTKNHKLRFHTSQSTPTSLGWKELFIKFNPKDLLDVKENQTVDILEINDVNKTTKAPKRYTDGALVNVMKNAHLLIPKSEAELRKRMKEKDNPGLGTSATRTGIINNLCNKGYVDVITQNKEKILKPTEKGLNLILKLSEKSALTDPILTALWEENLLLINKGKLSKNEFISEIQSFILEEIKKFDELNLKELKKAYNCPVCKNKSVSLNKAGAFCDNCNKFIIYRKFLNKKLTDSQILKLLEGNSIDLTNLKSKAGNTFNATLTYSTKENKINLTFNNKKTYKSNYKKSNKSNKIKSKFKFKK